MRDTIIKLFNLEPSDLEDVEVVSTDYSVFAIITLRSRRQQCPAYGCSTKRIHGYRKRTLTHAVLNDVYTTIVFNQRRYRCVHCNKTSPEINPFAFPNRRVSSYVILRVMKMLRNPRMTFSQVADDVNLSVSSVCRIFDKYTDFSSVRLTSFQKESGAFTVFLRDKPQGAQQSQIHLHGYVPDLQGYRGGLLPKCEDLYRQFPCNPADQQGFYRRESSNHEKF